MNVSNDEIFLVSGARRNSEPFSNSNMAGCYDACIYEIDFGHKRILRKVFGPRPDRSIYPGGYTFSYRGSHFDGQTIHTCSHSEIVEIDYATFDVKDVFTHPVFNDLHHVRVFNGSKYFVSTGVDHVGELRGDNSIHLHPVILDDKLPSVNGGKDYRSLDTKPHVSHPNFIFEINGEKWVTRFKQKDAVKLSDLNERMPIGDEAPHDGIVYENNVFFTTVDGKVVIVDGTSRDKLGEYDINEIVNVPKLGWCRGIEVFNNMAYVGFTAFRKTKHRENVRWLTNTWEKVRGTNPGRIVKFDFQNQKVVDEMIFSVEELSVIFSIVKV